MANIQPEYCVYTALHGPLLKYAVIEHGRTDIPFCMRSKTPWRKAQKLLERTGSLRVLIRNIEDPGADFAITYSAELFDIWFEEDFKTKKKRREFLEDELWLQREMYEEEGLAEDAFRKREFRPSMKAVTLFRINNLRRIKRTPISRLTKDNGQELSGDYKYGYANCRMPKEGSKLYNRLTKPVDPKGDDVETVDLGELDERYSGTPEYFHKVVQGVRRPSAIRNAILKKFGTKCRICGTAGFKKKNGQNYAETHHMIELNKQAPQTLQSWNVIVVCPTCHKKLHHAKVKSEFLDPGWRVRINGKEFEWRR